MTESTEPAIYQIAESSGLPHRLGRNVHHDPRSRGFAFRAAPGTPLESVHWERAVPIFDQGDLGSCCGNAAAGWLGTANALRPGLEMLEETGHPLVDEHLAVDLYSDATAIDPYDGAYPPEDTGSDGLSVAKVLQQRGLVDSYAHAFDVTSVLAALQSGPVLIGTVWHEGMFTARADGLVEISGDVAGGHEYLAVGYEPAGTGPVPHSDVVVLANSWGTGWGEGGFFRMTVDTLTTLLAADGDATIPHALVAAPPAPGPGAGFPVDLDPDVAAKVAHLAARRRIAPSAWVNQRLRAYLD